MCNFSSELHRPVLNEFLKTCDIFEEINPFSILDITALSLPSLAHITVMYSSSNDVDSRNLAASPTSNSEKSLCIRNGFLRIDSLLF